MEVEKFGERMEKIKIIFISLFLLLSINIANSYEISDLIKILVEKNKNNSSFKYDDLIEDLEYKSADTIYIPQIDYSYDYTNDTSSTSSTSTINSQTNTISATVNLYNGGYSQLNLITTQTRNQAFDYLREYQKELF